MDSTASLQHLRQSASVSSRLSAIDVSQLDKINAIPNKTTNNVLTDGLCQEDQLYLDALMDEESLDSDDDATSGAGAGHGGSPWSPPMAERPMLTVGKKGKRLKRMRPSYAITLSLEDISYIRPSWGMSKGIKRIEINKNKKLNEASTSKNNSQDEDSQQQSPLQHEKKGAAKLLDSYHISLAVLLLFLLFLMLLAYVVDLDRKNKIMYQFRLEFEASERRFKILKLKDGVLLERRRSLSVHYGRAIPRDLKHEECTCEMFESEFRKHSSTGFGGRLANESAVKGECFACLNWAQRANLQVLVNGSSLFDARDLELEQQQQQRKTSGIPLDDDLSIICYDIKWQSYDFLKTPLVDCFQINEGDQWLGLGDLQSSTWPLNKYNQLEPTVLLSNLSSEFGLFNASNPAFNSYDRHRPPPWSWAPSNSPTPFDRYRADSKPDDGTLSLKANPSGPKLMLGSHVELQLLTSSGFFVGNLKTDFQPSIQISKERRELCLSVACLDGCSQIWARPSDLERFGQRNNLLEYSICSANSWRVLVSRLITERQRKFSGRNTTNPPALQKPQMEVTPTQNESTTQINQNLRAIEQTEQLIQIAHKTTPSSSNQEQRLVNQQAAPATNQIKPKRLLDGIGLIERTLFVTSPEYIETLDGKTLRQHVDKIVKLNLKTSPIIIIDTRWQRHLGSFKFNNNYFPKAKLLFEILHNKGFKIVLSINPYLDTSIGLSSLKQLLEAGRLVTQSINYYAQFGLPDIDKAPALDPDHIMAAVQDANGDSLVLPSKVLRRRSFFHFRNETILVVNGQHLSKTPYLFNCKEYPQGHCVLIDLLLPANRQWLIESIKRSSVLMEDADAIQLTGAHPDAYQWEHPDGYRAAMAELIETMYYRDGLYVLPKWTGNFNYIQVAPRTRDWDSLRACVDSVLTLGMLGYSLIHPGSVWGDLKLPVEDPTTVMQRDTDSNLTGGEPSELGRTKAKLSRRLGENKIHVDENLEDLEDLALRERRGEEELIVRWLQVAVFLPVLQFNDLSPIEKFSLQDQLIQLVRLRKLFIVPEIKRNLPHTPLLPGSGVLMSNNRNNLQLPTLRHTWAQVPGNSSQQPPVEPQPEAVGQQFMIGPDILVAPVLVAGQRQKDIYLPAGIWHDELRQTNIRGAKWLRNYPIELYEVAWFTRARR